MSLTGFLPNTRLSPLVSIIIVGGLAVIGATRTTAAWAEADDDAADESTFLGQGTSISLGGGPLVAPAYEGARKEKVDAFPYIKVDGLLNDHVSVTTGQGVAVNLLGAGDLHAGFSIGYSGGRSAGDDPRLRGTRDISTAAAPGAFINYEFQDFTFALDVKDRLGNDKGVEGTFSAEYSFKPMPALKIAIGPKVTFGDKQYNNTFFGVTETEAARAVALGNPLRAYTAKAGIKDAGIMSTAFYKLSERWRLAGVVGITELLGKDAQSPLVQHRLQPEVGLGIVYKF